MVAFWKKGERGKTSFFFQRKRFSPTFHLVAEFHSATRRKGGLMKGLYEKRFDERARARKEQVWKVLCEHFFQRFIGPGDTVLDLGAGYCEFINNIRCQQRWAIEVDETLWPHAREGVKLSRDLEAIPHQSIDVAFASNFFEHLKSKENLLETLMHLRLILKPSGRLIILQPNIKYLYKEFWDFLDHHLPLSHKSMEEALALTGFRPLMVIPRFLPFTTKSRLPQHPFLVKAYLHLPILYPLFGKQMLIVAEKEEKGERKPFFYAS